MDKPIRSMNWEEVEKWETRLGDEQRHYANREWDWCAPTVALHIIALARWEKERADKAEASLALADKLAEAVEKYCCNVGAVKGYKLREPMADTYRAYLESRK